MTDCLIVGAGPAGLTAAIYACRAGLSVTVIEESLAGGQMTSSIEVGNYPGFGTVSGAELADRMEKQARNLGAEFRTARVTGFQFKTGALRVVTREGSLSARTTILAMGARPRKLGIPGEERLIGRGVSYCATCDGHFFLGKDVAVVGGGDTALEDAVFLTGLCRSVTLVHRRDVYRAQRHLQKMLPHKENLRQKRNRELAAIEGDERVSQVTLRHVQTGRTEVLPLSAVFIAVGTEPRSELLQGILPLDDDGHVLADENGSTALPGVFVAGDLRSKPLYQIVTACADGAVAAVAALRFIEGGGL